ncbi:hypothetical protein HPP92_025400 [Vanilla planifolia]|uniref:Uncharacterized protein n=1 Tax=Vanilla planifolia TaxID=51239 RepID=A0A835PFB3_VANPL|nr:hypothetical protein HPP92_025400 [Vanilla planifolia]
MAASSQMKKRVKRQTSEGTSSSSSVASPSSIRPKPLACRVYIGRIGSPYCAFIALALLFVLCATWNDTTSEGHVLNFTLSISSMSSRTTLKHSPRYGSGFRGMFCLSSRP